MGGWLYKHENITNSVEVGAGAELGKMLLSLDLFLHFCVFNMRLILHIDLDFFYLVYVVDSLLNHFIAKLSHSSNFN